MLYGNDKPLGEILNYLFLKTFCSDAYFPYARNRTAKKCVGGERIHFQNHAFIQPLIHSLKQNKTKRKRKQVNARHRRYSSNQGTHGSCPHTVYFSPRFKTSGKCGDTAGPSRTTKFPGECHPYCNESHLCFSLKQERPCYLIYIHESACETSSILNHMIYFFILNQQDKVV